ncbi:hypothetical protein HC928_20495 [bacterium]|nr:hypothetical protein [bacterium]
MVHNGWECGDLIPNLVNAEIGNSKTQNAGHLAYEARVTGKTDNPELAAYANQVEFDWFRVQGNQTFLLDAKEGNAGGVL